MKLTPEHISVLEGMRDDYVRDSSGWVGGMKQAADEYIEALTAVLIEVEACCPNCGRTICVGCDHFHEAKQIKGEKS